jgi:hypothetical protein
MCLYPKLIDNPKYKVNKKNGGIVPPFPIHNGKSDNRVGKVPIGCGKCMECMKDRALQWKVRLFEEIKENKNGHFVTLTFNPESLKYIDSLIDDALDGYDRDNAIAKKAVRLFLERWRKKFGKSIRHWLVTELGHKNTEHLHLHGILFTDENADIIRERWGYGFIWDSTENNGYVNEKTVNYITKYITKVDLDHKYYKPIVLCSPGIGKGYINSPQYRDHTYKDYETNDFYRSNNGYKIKNPIYYRNYLYSEDEREKLWLNTLDKDERWVDGIKAVDDEDYYKMLYEARIKNNRLGYGDDNIDWSLKLYENYRRSLKIREKIAMTKSK